MSIANSIIFILQIVSFVENDDKKLRHGNLISMPELHIYSHLIQAMAFVTVGAFQRTVRFRLFLVTADNRCCQINR